MRKWTDCKLFYFLYNFLRQYSSMLLVLMSIKKCFAVYFPLKSKSICTVKTAKWVSGIVGVTLAGYNSMELFVTGWQVDKLFGLGYCISDLADNYYIIFNNVDSALYSFGPFVIMFITNFAIAFKFMRARCTQSNSTESTNQALVKVATRGTAMVVTVSVTFIILTAPTALSTAVMHFFLLQDIPLYLAFMNLTQYLNHSINGVLYCIVGSRFRRELLNLFNKKERSENISPLFHTLCWIFSFYKQFSFITCLERFCLEIPK